MDVNSSDWSQHEFIKMSSNCNYKEQWMCKRTSYACKDYLCPIVKSVKNIAEVRSNFAQQPLQASPSTTAKAH